MHDDSNNEEISISVKTSQELTGFGLEAKAKSRAVGAIDRLIGDGANFFGNYFRRSVSENEAKGIVKAAAANSFADHVSKNPELAADILGLEFSQAARRHSNKEGVVLAAVEQLKIALPSDSRQDEGPEALSEDFMSRFERYAEDASTDDIQEKWASVLASEVRQPGTFNNRVMRILDEIEAETAKEFRKFSEFQISGCVPKYAYELNYDERRKFDEAELMGQSISGVSKFGVKNPTSDGGEPFFFLFKEFAVALDSGDAEKKIGALQNNEVLDWSVQKNAPTIPIHNPTLAGTCLFKIVMDKSEGNVKLLVEKIRGLGFKTYLYKRELENPESLVDTGF